MKKMVSVLIAEDETTSRNSIRDCVADLGIKDIFLAENGRQALEIYKIRKPDIIITDIEMPVMDGIELVNNICNINQNTAIIFLTAHSNIDYMKKAIRAGVIDYVLKPVSADELEYAITRGIEKINSFARNNLNVLREKLFKDIIGGYRDYSDGEYARMCRELELPVDHAAYTVITIRLCNTNDRIFDINKPLALQATPIGGTVYALLKSCDFYYSFVSDFHEIISVCCKSTSEKSLDDIEQEWMALAIQLGENIQSNCLKKAEVKLGKSVVSLSLLSRCMKTLKTVYMQDEPSQNHVAAAITEKDKHVSERIKNIIEENYDNPSLKVNDIAEELYYTSAYLCMVFKKATGITINDYMNIYRIKKAKEFMKDNSLRIIDISIKAGYNNDNYFSKVFKKYEGISPKEYRNKITAPE